MCLFEAPVSTQREAKNLALFRAFFGCGTHFLEYNKPITSLREGDIFGSTPALLPMFHLGEGLLLPLYSQPLFLYSHGGGVYSQPVGVERFLYSNARAIFILNINTLF